MYFRVEWTGVHIQGLRSGGSRLERFEPLRMAHREKAWCPTRMRLDEPTTASIHEKAVLRKSAPGSTQQLQVPDAESCCTGRCTPDKIGQRKEHCPTIHQHGVAGRATISCISTISSGCTRGSLALQRRSAPLFLYVKENRQPLGQTSHDRT